MSHLACPLCAKNCALSVWDPEHYYDDLEVLSYENLGYRRGFAPINRRSVLGDEEITPRVVSRCTRILHFCIKEEPDYMKQVVEGLKVKDYFLNTRELISVKEYEDISRMLIQENRARISTENALQQRGINDLLARDEIEKLRNELNTHKRVDQILGWFMTNCETECIPDERYGFLIVIHEVPVDTWEVVKNFSVGIHKEVIKLLQKRMKARNPEIEDLLKRLVYKRRKTIAERLLEMPFNPAN